MNQRYMQQRPWPRESAEQDQWSRNRMWDRDRWRDDQPGFAPDVYGSGLGYGPYVPGIPGGYADPRSGRWDYPYPGDGGRRGGEMSWSSDYPNERGLLDRATDEVSSWFGDQAATRRREADHRGKGPRGYRRSDDRIQEAVCDALTDDPAVDASNIDVSVADGEVTLTGTVTSRDAKRRAEVCCERVSGVAEVQNSLRVQPAAPATASGAGPT